MVGMVHIQIVPCSFSFIWLHLVISFNLVYHHHHPPSDQYPILISHAHYSTWVKSIHLSQYDVPLIPRALHLHFFALRFIILAEIFLQIIKKLSLPMSSNHVPRECISNLFLGPNKPLDNVAAHLSNQCMTAG